MRNHDLRAANSMHKDNTCTTHKISSNKNITYQIDYALINKKIKSITENCHVLKGIKEHSDNSTVIKTLMIGDPKPKQKSMNNVCFHKLMKTKTRKEFINNLRRIATICAGIEHE